MIITKKQFIIFCAVLIALAILYRLTGGQPVIMLPPQPFMV